jgi:hypothetical protein
MPKVKSGYGKKWARVTPQRTEDYQQGVQNPKVSWQAATLAAEKNQADGIQQAITDKRFAKGVQKAGDAAWQAGALQKGVNRFGEGVQVSESKYEAAFAPYAQVIESTQLPPRYPKGDPRNVERVKAIATALRNKKVKG